MGRSGQIILVVVAASAVVAIGAGGAGLLVPPADLSAVWSWLVRLLGAAVVMGGLAGLLRQRERLRSAEDRHYDPAISGLAAAGGIMAVLALTALLAPDRRFEQEAGRDAVAGEQGGPTDESRPSRAGSSSSRSGGISGGFGLGLSRGAGGGRSTERSGAQGTGSTGGTFDWSFLHPIARVILLVLLLGVAAIGIRGLMGRPSPGRSDPALAVVAAAEAEASLQASLDEVAYDGRNPREGIVAAYHRLLAALAAAGSPRQPQEAPHEHLHRVLAPLGVDAEPMHRLTELYVVAQFTERPITEQHRSAAGDALESALDSLRAARGAPSAARPRQGAQVGVA